MNLEGHIAYLTSLQEQKPANIVKVKVKQAKTDRRNRLRKKTFRKKKR
ncbi:MAG: hypothetical protein R2800_08000 [Flavipsychrobacter sp.]